METEGVKVEDSEAAHQGALDVLATIMSNDAQKAYFDTYGLGEAYTFIADADNEESIFEYTSSLSDTYKQEEDQDGTDASQIEQHVQDGQIEAFTLIISDPHLADCIGGVLHEQIRGTAEIAGISPDQQAGPSPNQQAKNTSSTSIRNSSEAVTFDTSGAQSGAQVVQQEEATYDAWTAFLSSDQAKEETEWLDLAARELRDVLEEDSLPITTFAEGMSNIWNAERGNLAGSSVGRSVNEALGSDFVVMSPYSIRTPLYPGDMTATMVRFPVAEDPVYILTITGADLRALLEEMLAEHTGYRMPILAGLKMTISQDKNGVTHLEKLERTAVPQEENRTTPAGQSGQEETQTIPLNDGDSYTVVFAGPELSYVTQKAQELQGVKQGRTLQDIWSDFFQAEGDVTVGLLPSVDYLDVR